MTIVEKLHLGGAAHRSGSSTPGGRRRSESPSPCPTPPTSMAQQQQQQGSGSALSYFSKHAGDRLQHISEKAAAFSPFKGKRSISAEAGQTLSGYHSGSTTPLTPGTPGRGPSLDHSDNNSPQPSPASEDDPSPSEGGHGSFRSPPTSPASQASGGSRHGSTFSQSALGSRRTSSKKRQTPEWPPSEWWSPHDPGTPPPRPRLGYNSSGGSRSGLRSVAAESEEDLQTSEDSGRDGKGQESSAFRSRSTDKEATPIPGYGFAPPAFSPAVTESAREFGRKGGEMLKGAGQAIQQHQMFHLPFGRSRVREASDKVVVEEPAKMSTQEEDELEEATRAAAAADRRRPSLGKLRQSVFVPADESPEATPTVTTPQTGLPEPVGGEEQGQDGEGGDDVAICDSPGATQSLAPRPHRWPSPVSSEDADDERSAGPGRQASLDAASVMIMDSPAATQSIDIEAQLRYQQQQYDELQRGLKELQVGNDDRDRALMSTNASFDPNADPQVFDSPSHTQNLGPDAVLGARHPDAGGEEQSSSKTLPASEREGQQGHEGDLVASPEGLSAVRGKNRPSVGGSRSSTATSHVSSLDLPKPLPHHSSRPTRKVPPPLAPRPPAVPHPAPQRAGHLSTSSSTTSPPSVTSSSTTSATTSNTSSPASTPGGAHVHRVATPTKMWKPPQHPDIVKKQGGGQRLIKETLDATSGKNEEGQRMVNQYILRNELGRGSFGAVQLAQDAESGRECAIKVFSKARMRRKMRQEMKRNGGIGPSGEAADDGFFLIRNEVAIMKKVDHPNVVALYEVLDVEGEDNLYMVMEYCRGGPLMKVQPGEEGAALELERARRYFRQIVVGVDYLHQNEIIHHDIKPDNILLTSDRKTCKIVDFGVSAMFNRPGDDSSVRAMGSPAFASPELCGMPVDHISGTAADIWAMGVTLYCMLTGQLPFGRSGQIVEMYQEIKEAAPPIPDDWEDSLVDLMTRLLDKDQETRIKIAELREHPWVTASGLRPLPAASENSKPVGPITETDVRHSFRHAISSSVQGFVDVIELSVAASRKYGETHEHGRRREFFKEFYRQISARSAEKHAHSRSQRASSSSRHRPSVS